MTSFERQHAIAKLREIYDRLYVARFFGNGGACQLGKYSDEELARLLHETKKLAEQGLDRHDWSSSCICPCEACQDPSHKGAYR